MTKFLLVGFLLAFSSLATACSDKEHAEKSKVNPTDPVALTDKQAKELDERKKRAAQKGNILDSFDPEKAEKPSNQGNKKSNNILDDFEAK